MVEEWVPILTESFRGNAMSHTTISATFKPELIDGSAYLAPDVVIRGHVRIGAESSVWFGAVIRGDTEVVEIGRRSNIQDLAVVHCDPGFPCQIGDQVTLGHGAIVHGASIGNGSLIGIRAVVLNGACIGAGSLIGAGAVVPEGSEIPPGVLAVGIPARVVRDLTSHDVTRIQHAANHYVQAAQAYREAESPTPRSTNLKPPLA